MFLALLWFIIETNNTHVIKGETIGGLVFIFPLTYPITVKIYFLYYLFSLKVANTFKAYNEACSDLKNALLV